MVNYALLLLEPYFQSVKESVVEKGFGFSV